LPVQVRSPAPDILGSTSTVRNKAPPDSLDNPSTAYNRTNFIRERREMMQEWADYLDRIKAEAEVISITPTTREMSHAKEGVARRWTRGRPRLQPAMKKNGQEKCRLIEVGFTQMARAENRLLIFVNLDCAAHRLHHGTDIVGHIWHAVACFVEPVAPDRQSDSILANEFANARTRQR
jgi:hypothetical protein